MKLNGIHHVSCITGNAQLNVDFYTRVLGMRLVKKTVNQDDPSVYHLFYADDLGNAGADLTFFEYPHAAPGRPGRRHDPYRRAARRIDRRHRLLASPARCRARLGPSRC